MDFASQFQGLSLRIFERLKLLLFRSLRNFSKRISYEKKNMAWTWNDKIFGAGKFT